MEESRAFLGELLSLCIDRIRIESVFNAENDEFIEIVKNFEVTRRKWLQAELELKKYKELLVKSDVAKAALEVKLKHARNQVDLEIKKKFKIEEDYQYLQRQMQLICDILVHDSKSSACLNEQQKSLLANFNHKGASISQHKSSKHLCVIDESSFLSHSDISYDRTDDDLDLDTTGLRPLRSRVREKRRSSMGPTVGGPAGMRGRVGNCSGDLLERKTLEKEVQTIGKASVTTLETGGQIHVVIDITQEIPAMPPSTLQQDNLALIGDQTTVWESRNKSMAELDEVADVETMSEVNIGAVYAPAEQKPLNHVFLSRTVIRPETCVPCGKRIRFGKVALKCRDCRVVAHPECKHKCLAGCMLSATSAAHGSKDTLESFAPVTSPRVPLLIVECVNEIERRGLEEKGIYRVPGCERLVKELREKYIQGRGSLMLSKVAEIHVVCGLLKDFLRKLKEPLVTIRLHKTFMQASEMPDEESSVAIMRQAIWDLPKANRDTLAFLMLHLQKVMKSPHCQMDKNNLARVFGPTIVGHGMADPSPVTILRDTNRQYKVISYMLTLPEDYWMRFLQQGQGSSSKYNAKNQNDGQERLFKPLTSPELNVYYKAQNRGSPRSKISYLGGSRSNM
ncbi:rac GTPase-activating protein 1 [Lampris incognitus]|uniref:rac GTPase-activating protein 1 n=1 Tax=Lampris incognitus TaxID=2546036 RepID=UPI0024B4A390|nr:rac GTPase-activating protein 1 [Lampris incognitus]